jgi:hypothetical protein
MGWGRLVIRGRNGQHVRVRLLCSGCWSLYPKVIPPDRPSVLISMDDITPLSSLDAFREWPAPRSWGPESAWQATFGGGVVADFAKGLRAHPAAVARRFPAKAEAYPVVLGCVPWLTSQDVVDALVGTTNHVCVVVDKSARGDQLDRLHREGVGVRQDLLGDLEFWGPPEGGRPPIIHPSHIPGHRALEPVRVVGWRRQGNEQVPLLHAKLAVCCAAYTWEGEMGGWDDHLLPMSVWMGSANWTTHSRRHLEFGAWSTDPPLAEAALEFITDVIKASEPLPSQAERPSPQLVEGEWDDDAFAELADAVWESHAHDPDE